MKPAPRLTITPMSPTQEALAGFGQDMAAFAALIMFVGSIALIAIAYHGASL